MHDISAGNHARSDENWWCYRWMKGLDINHVSCHYSRQQTAASRHGVASFVQFLSDNNKPRFQDLLLAIQDGDGLSLSFKKHYGVSLADKWQEFIASRDNSS